MSLEIKEIEGTMSKFPTLPKEWGFTGLAYGPLLFFYYHYLGLDSPGTFFNAPAVRYMAR